MAEADHHDTSAQCEWVCAGSRQIDRHGEARRCRRALYLIIQPSGVKPWAARHRHRGRSRKYTLGPVLIRAPKSDDPLQDGAPLSFASARELCARVLRKAQAGRDPAVAKRQRRELEHAAAADTLEAVCEERLRRESGRELRTLDSQRRPDLELFYPALGQLPIDQIRCGQFVRVLDAIADSAGGSGLAARSAP